MSFLTPLSILRRVTSSVLAPYFSFICCHTHARFAAANSVFDGIHPVQVQSPPTRDDSTRQTDLPKLAANFAAVMPADPPPMTMRSYVVDGGSDLEKAESACALDVM